MAVHTPTVTNFPNGVITITSLDSTLYDAIIESLGSYYYVMTDVYIQSNSVEQMLEPLGFFKYDVNGNITDNKVIPTLDPNQDQLSLFIEFASKGYILDGKLYIEYNLQPNETVNFYIGNIQYANSMELPDNDGFPKDFLKDYGFFENFTDELPPYIDTL